MVPGDWTSVSNATAIRAEVQYHARPIRQSCVKLSAETGPVAHKPLFRVQLSQLLPGHSGTLCGRAGNTGGSLSTVSGREPTGKGVEL